MFTGHIQAIHFLALVCAIYGVREFAHEVSLHIATKDFWWLRKRH
uniref:Uncharacterized protein n=1 Tax=Myoviridae sp. ctu2j3 TaxID=2825197 RepID=A0A8S5UI15_9CAUD|nr:MAG TPA: hypothetical protein [Myoviridae sp. ctu2j3]DAF94274.1 MAG TPA: hypothetical protein [Myoviridae sp. ctu2j3]